MSLRDTELSQLLPTNLELEEDETIDNPITVTKGISTLLHPEDPPHGRHLGLYSTVVLFVCRMVGSGIFATPGGIYKDANASPLLFLMTWSFGAFIAISGLSVYLELGSLLPRSGGTKIFLEYLFPRPKYYFTFVFGAFNVFFNISGGNALVFGEYIGYAFGYEQDEKRSRNLGLLLMLFAFVVYGSSKKVSVFVQNVVGGMKLIISSLIIIVTIYVMILPFNITHIENQLAWEDLFTKPDFSKVSLAVLSSAVLRTIYSFGGWTTPLTVQNEIKDPVKTLKVAAPWSMGFVIALYMLLNLSYLVVIPSEKILDGGELVGAILFETLFGDILGRRILSLVIAISSASTLFVIVYADSLMIQTIAREGFLPFSSVLSSHYPFGTPLAALTLNIVISTSVLFLPQKGSLYNYIISMQTYPNLLFHAILCFGIYKARHRFPRIKAPIQSSHISVSFCFLSSVIIFIAPMTSPSTLVKSYSFGGLVLFVLATIYWFIVVKFLPWFCGYKIATETIYLHDGLKVKKWGKQY